ncbi:hypothetical protein DCAR_0310335 [Daucus carota subsp. sativus]|uniref:Uncharacterized protein n=1 Tax=Daucus carota subsp. sativus TaxID=79200 RepID=A0AAF0WJM3_DAUCS|nr:hypothetical protein DCAR_0310335 [Daucus carota subsp. sativus]
MRSNKDEDDDLADRFSELETLASADETQARSASCEGNDELISESELSDGGSDDEVAGCKKELQLSDIKAERSKKKFEQKRSSGKLLNAVITAPALSIKSVLHKWVEDGNEVKKSDTRKIISYFQKRRMYRRALQVC